MFLGGTIIPFTPTSSLASDWGGRLGGTYPTSSSRKKIVMEGNRRVLSKVQKSVTFIVTRQACVYLSFSNHTIHWHLLRLTALSFLQALSQLFFTNALEARYYYYYPCLIDGGDEA